LGNSRISTTAGVAHNSGDCGRASNWLCVSAASPIRLSRCSNLRGPHARVHRFCFLRGSHILYR